MSHYISTNRSKHYLKCHLILVTKYRRNILVGQLNNVYIILKLNKNLYIYK